jgi:hypothetical protein
MVLRGHHCGLPPLRTCLSAAYPRRRLTPARTVTRALPAVVASGLISQPAGEPTLPGSPCEPPGNIPASRETPASQVGGGRGGPPLARPAVQPVGHWPAEALSPVRVAHYGDHWYSSRSVTARILHETQRHAAPRNSRPELLLVRLPAVAWPTFHGCGGLCEAICPNQDHPGHEKSMLVGRDGDLVSAVPSRHVVSAVLACAPARPGRPRASLRLAGAGPS